MADQHLRRRRPKSKGKKRQAEPKPLRLTRDQRRVIENSPNLKNPSKTYGKAFTEDDLEGLVFLRFTCESEVHNGYQWRTGLNVDPLEFSYKTECGPGGLYFCEVVDAPQWARGCLWVRQVRPVPTGAGPGSGVVRFAAKWKAKQVMAEQRRGLDDYATWEWVMSLVRTQAEETSIRYMLRNALSDPGLRSRKLRMGLLARHNGCLQDLLQHTGKSFGWGHSQAASFAKLYRGLVSSKDWNTCCTVYPDMELRRMTALEYLLCSWAVRLPMAGNYLKTKWRTRGQA